MSAAIRDLRELDDSTAAATVDLTGRLSEALNPVRWTTCLRLLAFGVEVAGELGVDVLEAVVTHAEQHAA